MMFGFMGKILLVDVSSKDTRILSHDLGFYKNYLGGSFLVAKLFDEQISKHPEIDPFSSANPIIFAPGVLAGGSVCGATRVNILSLSPETPGVFLSQAGGEFGPNIKRAGYDALIVTGKASSPIYIVIDGDKVSFENGSEYWGRDRVEVYDSLFNKLGNKYAIASIGVAGENKVCNANLMLEPDHYAGRGGLGAVLGSKNLKAICIRGDQKPEFADDKKVKEINKIGARAFKTSFSESPDGFLGVLRQYGTYGLLQLNQEGGNLPVNNFSETWLEDEAEAERFNHENGENHYVGKKVPCKGCFIACKKASKTDPPLSALPEYESMALLGPNIGITNPQDMLEICELCNHLGVDTISIGNMVAYVMACFEKGLISEESVGFKLAFGDTSATIKLIHMISERKGDLGALLASGMEKTCAKLGEETRSLMRFSKGVGLPAHLPRVKPGIGFGYLHGPNPGDHMKLEHDWIASVPSLLTDFGLEITSGAYNLDKNKVEIARATQIYYSAMDTLSTCMFVFGPGNILSYEQIVDIVNAATGFDYTFADLMKIGENAIQLQKKLFIDFGGSDEILLPYLKTPIPSGPSKGLKIDEADFEESRKHYYSLWNWDENGRPQQEVLDSL
jgi:aldehyde:ferredoxin oxidoreductase